MGLRISIVGIGLVTAISAAGCSSKSTPNTTDDTGVAGDAPGDSNADGAGRKCEDCQNAKCGKEAAACFADPPCKKLTDCMVDCLKGPDAGGCQASCEKANPSTLGAAFLGCLRTTCGDVCLQR